MTRIFFARHGETEWNSFRRVQGSTDTHLNANGIHQAERLAESLRDKEITQIFTAKMHRARETAQIVAQHLHVPLTECDGLQELNLGDWEGCTWPEIERRDSKTFAEWSRNKRFVRPPNGETYDELLNRFTHIVLQIVRNARGNVLIVTHSACMLAFQAELKRTPLESMMSDYTAPNAEAIAFSSEEILNRWENL